MPPDFKFPGTIGALWAFLITLTAGAAVFGLRQTLDSASKILVAVIGATAILLGAILTHVLTIAREQQLARERRVQEHYKVLLAKLAIFIRDPEKQNDEFASIYFETCVVSSSDVIYCLRAFRATQTKETLKSLLTSMRSDIGLEDADLDMTNVLPPPTPAPLVKSLT